ncbi:hypothetical protein ZWY2020_029500 [Hordeum vulgare]|nr:hypothetical protein ZWY2020_029500 [Hordeum vulgare]
MWKKAVDRERRSAELAYRLQPSPPPAEAEAETPAGGRGAEDGAVRGDAAESGNVFDSRKAAKGLEDQGSGQDSLPAASNSEKVTNSGDSYPSKQASSKLGTPGPDFWSWLPPVDSSSEPRESNTVLKPSKKVDSFSSQPEMLMEKGQQTSYPFRSWPLSLRRRKIGLFLLPVIKWSLRIQIPRPSLLLMQRKHLRQFSQNAAEAARALSTSDDKSSHGIDPDGSKPDGVVCKWTVVRGVSADGSVEFEDKYWEASDGLIIKIRFEKSGFHIWSYAYGEDGRQVGKEWQREQWQEKWWEQYDSSGKAEKSADKWCSLDPNTPLDAGHAHVWHERWGETYDGCGGSVKYTDKWAERSERHDVKQGETWWEGKYRDRWNRTWGEGHNGSSWVPKYSRSSGSEHWDTHEPQETWYESYPHFGFHHCFELSATLVRVRQPPKNFKLGKRVDAS